MCVSHERYECLGVLKQKSWGSTEVYVMACYQGLADAEQDTRRVWYHESAVFLDKVVEIVICALDKCCECPFVCGSACGPSERCYCGVMNCSIGQEGMAG